MRSRVLEAVIALCAAAAGGDAFVGCNSSALKAARRTNRASLLASRENIDNVAVMFTRRDFVESTGAAVAGVLGCSLLLPAASIASTASDREGGSLPSTHTNGRGPILKFPHFCLRDPRAFPSGTCAILFAELGFPSGTSVLTIDCRRVGLVVYTTKGGVKFIVLKEGSGPVARDGDYCVVEFTGFLPDGQVFDASNAPGRKPIAFKLGARQVIQGWEEVLRLMNAGAEVQMVVPAAMAFGDKGICIENGDCLVKPGQEVRYDLQLKRVAVSP